MPSSELKISQKRIGWEDILDQFFEDRATIPFQWGVQDCSIIGSDAVMLMTGKDPMIGERNGYTNKFGALRLLREHHGVGILNAYSKVFDEMGFDEVDDVRYGDIAFVRVQNLDPEAARMFGGVTLVVGYNDMGAVVGPGKDGLILIEKYELVKAWRL